MKTIREIAEESIVPGVKYRASEVVHKIEFALELYLAQQEPIAWHRPPFKYMNLNRVTENKLCSDDIPLFLAPPVTAGTKHVCNLWVDPVTRDYVIDHCDHPPHECVEAYVLNAVKEM